MALGYGSRYELEGGLPFPSPASLQQGTCSTESRQAQRPTLPDQKVLEKDPRPRGPGDDSWHQPEARLWECLPPDELLPDAA